MIPPPTPEFWSIERANAERAVALARFGFTDRQARFLVQVLLYQVSSSSGSSAGSPASRMDRRARTS